MKNAHHIYGDAETTLKPHKHYMLQFIVAHPLTFTLLTANIIIGLGLLTAGILYWRQSKKLWDMWLAIGQLIAEDTPEFFASFGGRFHAKNRYFGFEFVHILTEMFVIISLFWVLAICRFGKYLSQRSQTLRKMTESSTGYIY